MRVYIYHNSDVDGRLSAATMYEFLRGHSKPIDNQESITDIDIIEFPTDRLSYKFDMFDSLIIVLDTMYDSTFLYDLKYEIEEHSNFIWYFTNNISRYKTATSYINTSKLKDNFIAIFNPNRSISEIVYTFCMEKIDLTENWVNAVYGGNINKAKLDLHNYLDEHIPEIYNVTHSAVAGSVNDLYTNFCIGFYAYYYNAKTFFEDILKGEYTLFDPACKEMQEKIKQYVQNVARKGQTMNAQ